MCAADLTPMGLGHLTQFEYLRSLSLDHLVGYWKHTPLVVLTQLTALSITKSQLEDSTVADILSPVLCELQVDSCRPLW